MAQIVIEVPDVEITSDIRRQVENLLADSLYEFVSHRGPTAEAYVERRYSGPNYSWLNRPKKIEEVNKRIILANALHTAVLTSLKVEA